MKILRFALLLIIPLILICSAFSLLTGGDHPGMTYKDPKASIEDRVDALIARMTLKEKIGQLHMIVWDWADTLETMKEPIQLVNGDLGSIVYFIGDPEIRNQTQKLAMDMSRLKIPIIFGFDTIHGYRTVYPIPLALGCSWNPELVRQSCEVAAKESTHAGLDWTYAPMLDVSRDPRWGRVAECFGEDPYVNGIYGAASVRGFQGDDLTGRYSIAACLKHYVGYSESSAGKDYNFSDISNRAMQEIYLPPFKAGVEAGAVTVMSAFNDVSGIPASANRHYLTEILREKWGFNGFVVSDWEAVMQLVTQGYAVDEADAAEKAIEAGVDMDLRDKYYLNNLESLVEQGRVSMETVDEAVRRILRIKFRIGLFENPFAEVLPEQDRYLRKEFLEIAENLAVESMVLLKNEKALLPIADTIKSIAVIGPLASNAMDLLGSWRGRGKAEDTVTLLQGITSRAGENRSIDFAPGSEVDGEDRSGFAEAEAVALKADLVILCLGESARMSGENASRSTLRLPEIQQELLDAVSGTGTPIVLLLANGRPLELQTMEPKVEAILEIWQPGVRGGAAAADILFGNRNPSGKLSITFPRTTGQIPIYYNHRNSARPTKGLYRDISAEPMYWFGHGLSYSSFEYSELKLSSDSLSPDGTLTAEVTVTNTSIRPGKETVLWYIRDHVGGITRPLKQLKFFEKQDLPPEKAGHSVLSSGRNVI